MSLEVSDADRMDTLRQRTIATEFTLTGVGVHTGNLSELTVKPTESGGIRFKRMDLEGQPEVPARLDFVKDTNRGTSLAIGEVTVMTVEHIMGALMGMQVDHVLIELVGLELPILDGSFEPYTQAISTVGLKLLPGYAEVLSVQRPFEVHCKVGTVYKLSPSKHLQIDASINFEHTAIGVQSGSFEINQDTFTSEIAPARTFGFESEVASLRKGNLAKGASITNTIVLDEVGVVNGTLRFEDEFLRHKVGDVIGDLALIGKRIRANVICERPGHEGNVMMAKCLRDKVESNV